MVIPGTDCIQPKPTPQQIAQQTFDVMQRSAGVAQHYPALAVYNDLCSAREAEQHQLYVAHRSHKSATLAILDCFAIDA